MSEVVGLDNAFVGVGTTATFNGFRVDGITDLKISTRIGIEMKALYYHAGLNSAGQCLLDSVRGEPGMLCVTLPNGELYTAYCFAEFVLPLEYPAYLHFVEAM